MIFVELYLIVKKSLHSGCDKETVRLGAALWKMQDTCVTRVMCLSDSHSDAPSPDKASLNKPLPDRS